MQWRAIGIAEMNETPKRRPGRPLTSKERKTQHSVTLDKATVDKLLRISENLSEAICILAQRIG
jgi:uncharacterized protein (DUF4415 family)